jgi:hypothetical protein
MENIDELKKQIENLIKEIRDIKQRRITQEMIIPDVVKSRHVGEGVRFIRSGLKSDLPAKGEEPLQGTAIYFAYDENKLYVWNQQSGVWKSVSLV